MLAKVIGNYGGVKVDAHPSQNPLAELAAAEHNRQVEDAAQMTRTAYRALVTFTTSAAAPPFDLDPANVTHVSVWGSGASTEPTVRKLADGNYRVTYATSFLDALSVAESVSFLAGHVSALSSTTTDRLSGRMTSIATNIVELVLQRGDTGALTDIGNASAAVFTATVWLR